MVKSIVRHSVRFVFVLFCLAAAGLADGLDDQNPDLFNERGYRNGSSFDVTDQGEMVNEFNGNLIYKKTLLFQPGVGDLDLEITLNYNGAVAHTMQRRKNASGGCSPQSASFPMWILGVNGIAIDVICQNRYAYADTVMDSPRWYSYLVTGYDKSNEAVGGSSGLSKYSLSFLMADGTVEQYYDESGDPWSGLYLPYSPDNFSTGWLTYHYLYYDRQFYLKRPNGITTTYQEFVPRFVDQQDTTGTVGNPHLFLPVRIEDRQGNYIELQYSNSVLDADSNCIGWTRPDSGRPSFLRLKTSWGYWVRQEGASIDYRQVWRQLDHEGHHRLLCGGGTRLPAIQLAYSRPVSR